MKFDTMLVTGCSFTHGSETVTEGYSIENIQYSYARYFAEYMHLNYLNVAYPGASNEFIFHRTIKNITENVAFVLVAWTTDGREVWENKNEVFAFNSLYGAYDHVDQNETYTLEEHYNLAKIVSSNEWNLETVKHIHNALLHKFTSEDYDTKLKHYSKLIDMYCNVLNIPCHQVKVLPNGLDVTDIGKGSFTGDKHPTRKQQIDIFNKLKADYEQAR